MDISGSTAIVTGAASGIGAACARQLAARGATVVVADLQADKGEALAAEIKGVFAQVDVTETEQITAAVNAAAEIAPRWPSSSGSFRLMTVAACRVMSKVPIR